MDNEAYSLDGTRTFGVWFSGKRFSFLGSFVAFHLHSVEAIA